MSKIEIDKQEFEAALARSIPAHCRGVLRNYVLHGVPTGNFLRSTLSNDLFRAATGADDTNLAALPSYMRFLYNYAPRECWGSPATVTAWIARGGCDGFASQTEAA